MPKLSLCNRTERRFATVRRKRSNPKRPYPFATRNAAFGRLADQGEQVAQYKVYCIDGVNKIASADWLEADDDEAAAALVRERHDGFKCELWQGARLVERMDLRREA